MINDNALAAEKKEFFANWFDYVNDLSGPLGRRTAWKFYLDERRFVLEKLEAGALIHRSLRLPADADVPAAASLSDVGRFWTLDRSVADNWRAGGSYSEASEWHRGPGKTALISATTTIVDVDIVATVACRLGSSYESEVRLVAGRGVKILEVDIVHDDVPPPALC